MPIAVFYGCHFPWPFFIGSFSTRVHGPFLLALLVHGPFLLAPFCWPFYLMALFSVFALGPFLNLMVISMFFISVVIFVVLGTVVVLITIDVQLGSRISEVLLEGVDDGRGLLDAPPCSLAKRWP